MQIDQTLRQLGVTHLKREPGTQAFRGPDQSRKSLLKDACKTTPCSPPILKSQTSNGITEPSNQKPHKTNVRKPMRTHKLPDKVGYRKWLTLNFLALL